MLARMSPRLATFVVFLLNGAVFGTWASRVPALAEQIGAEVGSLGLALLGASVGLAFTAPLAARICAVHGSRGVLIASSLLSPLLLPVLALSQSPLQFGLTLIALGASVAAMDVSMNVAAVVVVRALQRPLMPQFHAGFSVGGLIGSLGSAAAAQAHWTPMKHFVLAAVVGVLVTAFIAQRIPGGVGERHREEVTERANVLKSPVLWLLASVALCSAIAEGAAADWSALFMVRERGMGDAAAAYAYAGFSVTMALARWFGEPIQRRLGSHRLLAVGGGLAATGLALAVVVPFPAAGYVGFGLAGLGLAFSFPVVMDLASEIGKRADGSGGERELGLVTTIAYSGFLAGPPIVGGLAHVSSLVVSLGFVALVTALIIPTTLLARRAARQAASV
ncbi:Predicted arabinose efflux permease, MFS family [Lentzea albidocapillata subsp. violacea]|uniref:Predicted arabinose efflux permease, MFS family n=2 Tax=Lentzea albidocapillata TaxID=40571 RepID=A0A1G9NN70_9PSEU|nr:Predicted arabinose efflux permease, MFS family [Lentzea albidocapillata subsp. violacea]